MNRKIEPKMVQFLDAKLASNGLAQNAIEEKNARELFACAMEACIGIREKGGNNKGPMVELIQETVGGAGREPWCMALVQTCIAYVEEKLQIHSRFPVTEHCMTAWRSAPDDLKVKFGPKRGAVVIWNHKGTDQGHTGMFRELKGEGSFKAVEGNTEAGVNANGKVERDGGGVYATVRSMRGNGSMILKGFLKPF
jgi:hypothetical protein